MSRHKFISTNRERFNSQRNNDFVSQQFKAERKNTERHRELLIPIDSSSRRQQWAGKPVRSEGKTSERDHKIPIFELLNFKESLLLRKDKDSFNLKTITKKRVNTNRMLTEKNPHPTHSLDKRQGINKILVRGGGYSKDSTPEKAHALKYEQERLLLSEKLGEAEGPFFKESPRRSLEKKLTPFQKEESKHFELLFVGNRRINSLADFTDAEGDPKVVPGDSIAYKYEIISLLGRGSFGRVFKAFDHKKKEYVALKIIKNQQKFTIQARVEIEILQTALLNDPKLRNNIVRLKGSFVFRGHTCLKFQILSKNLYEFIKQTNFAGFSLDLIRRFAIQILQALHFFHKQRIIHCDLKPENILLKQENKSGIKVIDVGSGCFEGRQIYTYIQSRFYRAPEIILGIKYTSAIDMWSFGCILVELYIGIPLFPGENQNQQMLMFIELLGVPPESLLTRAERRKKFFTDDFACKIPQPKQKRESINWKGILGSDCDKSFMDIVKRCLEWDPQQRLTPREALLHEWIIAGLPHTIRSQHVDQISNE